MSKNNFKTKKSSPDPSQRAKSAPEQPLLGAKRSASQIEQSSRPSAKGSAVTQKSSKASAKVDAKAAVKDAGKKSDATVSKRIKTNSETAVAIRREEDQSKGLVGKKADKRPTFEFKFPTKKAQVEKSEAAALEKKKKGSKALEEVKKQQEIEESDGFSDEDIDQYLVGEEDEDEDMFYGFDEDEDGFFPFDEDEDEDEDDLDDLKGFARLAKIAEQLSAEGYAPYADGDSEIEELDEDEDMLLNDEDEDEDEDEDDFLRSYFGAGEEDDDMLDVGDSSDDDDETILAADNDQLLSFDPKTKANAKHLDTSKGNSLTQKNKPTKRNEKSHDEDSEEDEDEKDVDEIAAEFDYRAIDPELDYHAVKGFVLNYIADPKNFNCNEFADTIVNQTEVGSVIVSGDAGAEPLAFATLLDIAKFSDLKCMKQIQSFILDNAGKDKAELQALFTSAANGDSKAASKKSKKAKPQSASNTETKSDISGNVALLVQDRIVNLPVELVPQLYIELLKDLAWAQKDSKGREFNFENVVVISKCSEVASSRLGSSGKASKKKSSEAEYWYTKLEDELFSKEATLIRTFAGAGTVSWPDYGQLPVSYRVMVVPIDGFKRTVEYLAQTIGGNVQGEDLLQE